MICPQEVARSIGVPDDKFAATCVLVDKLDKVKIEDIQGDMEALGLKKEVRGCVNHRVREYHTQRRKQKIPDTSRYALIPDTLRYALITNHSIR